MTGMSGFHVLTTHSCRCGRCGTRFSITTMSGPSRICETCAVRLLEIIWGRPVTGLDKFGNLTFGRRA